jgi:hypothetical protein
MGTSDSSGLHQFLKPPLFLVSYKSAWWSDDGRTSRLISGVISGDVFDENLYLFLNAYINI